MNAILKCFWSIILLFSLQLSIYSQDEWTVQTSPIDEPLNGVFFLNSTTGFIVGRLGTILKTTDGGENWNVIESNTLESLEDVYFVDDEVGYICGSSGKVFKTVSGGTSWTKLSTGTSTIYHSIFFDSGTSGYTVGDFGKIAHTGDGGDSWSFLENPANFGLYDINFNTPYYWVVGDGGMILNSSNGGTSWTQYSLGVSNRLMAVYPRSPDNIIVGDGGIVLKTEDAGQNWTAQYLFPESLNDICFPDDGDMGWIVGDIGKIFFTSDFGENWSVQATGTLKDLNAVFFIDASNGWAVGNCATILHYTGTVVPKTIYVDDDNNTGIEDGTLDHPFNTVAEGIDAAVVGDTVYIFCGDYPETPLTHLNLKAGITITGEGSDCTVIHVPFKNNIPFTQHLTAIRNVDCHSFDIEVSGAGPDFSEFYIGGSRVRHNNYYLTATKTGRNEVNTLTVENCILEGDLIISAPGNTAIQINNNTFLNSTIVDSTGTSPGVNERIIEENVFNMTGLKDPGDAAIITTSAGVTIQNNTIEISGEGTGILVGNGSLAVITGNTIILNDGNPVDQTAGIKTSGTGGNISGNTITGGYYGYYSNGEVDSFEYNTISKAHTGFYSSGSEKVLNNQITDCRGNGLIADGLTGPVQYNVITGNDSAGVVLDYPVDLGGGSENGEGHNNLQDNGYYGLWVRYTPSAPETIYAEQNRWNHTTEEEILNDDVLNEGGSNLTVSVADFLVLPDVPALVSPTNNSVNIDPNTVLIWNETVASDQYTLQLATDANFNNLIADTSGLDEPGLNLSLQSQTTYYWHVKATNLAGESDWSETWQFTTGVIGIDEHPKAGFDFQIFPNPAREVVSLKLSIHSSQSATVEVFDLNGRKHLEKQIPAGTETVEIDVSGLKSGVYFCRLIMENKSVTKKLIIQK